MLKSVIIGAGFVGQSYLRTTENIKKSKIIAVIDINEKLGNECANNYNVKYFKTLEEFSKKHTADIAIICVPTWLHEKCVIEAASYKLNIFCEKPVTFTLESFNRMIDACEKNNVKFMAAQVLRFWPEYEIAKAMLDENKLGKIKNVVAYRISEQPLWSSWHHLPEKSGGCLYDLGSHDIDFLQWTFGDVESVYATGFKTEYGSWNQFNVLIKFKNNVNANVECSFEMYGHYPYSMGLKIVGDENILDYRFESGHNLGYGIESRKLTCYKKDNSKPNQLEVVKYDPYAKELDYFSDCLTGLENFERITTGSTRKTIIILESIKKSLETNSVISL